MSKTGHVVVETECYSLQTAGADVENARQSSVA